MKQLTDQVTFRHGATLNSRLVQAPMLTNSGDHEAVSQDTLDYYGARSQSAAMVIVEYTSVRKNGGPSRSWADDREQLAIYDDSFKPGFTKLAKALKKDGNKAILQLVHSGREANYAPQLGRTVEVPTKMDFPWISYPVHELTDQEVRDVIHDFGTAAKRAIDCGFDGIEIHGANHYLIQQFFSAYSNRRTDHWGGSLEKRMNFPLAVTEEVMRVVKEYAPKDFIVGYRISPEEVHETVGYTWHESTQLIKALIDRFDLDYIHLSLPAYNAKPQDSDKTFAELFQPAIGSQAKEIIVGNVMSEADAKDALKLTDLVAMARATLIDPQIGLKISEGRGDEIVHQISPEQVKRSHLTPGLINLFSDPKMEPHLPGRESIYYLHEKGSLNKDVMKNGTSSSFNLKHFKK
ncbi:oxidoreductase [Limosilactobacillus sp.]|uniref:oxidoreductase n=1 Tax=Limosilactobacillus sp. TaxID=2773925 RepID=UPI0025C26626|nr:NADH-dependent oxidoreductase [Limosilactobacillus sp.]MCH3922905.1 NADH-dependent oxidoreductase [Limosilactobacillus sp.]MCH3927588.1 NADH-dependent oxidoreductase [Limosilactobacillus sp.]